MNRGDYSAEEGAFVPTIGLSGCADNRLSSLAAHVAVFAHGDQKYGDRPYVTHLRAVADILVDWGCDDDTVAAGWLHDILEDTGVDAHSLGVLFGPRVMWMVSSVTGEGDTRAEKMEHIYAEIAMVCPEAAVVKLADRIANVEAAPVGSRHLARYQAEQDGFRDVVRPRVRPDQWARLERAFAAKETTTAAERASVGMQQRSCGMDYNSPQQEGVKR